jgi:S-disulfanyl-L-cysteine oxidoreductase SoxD
MRTLHSTLVVAAALAAAAGPALGQSPDSAVSRSSRAGVYTTAQAERGAEVYAGFCRSCHAAASHTGVTFASWWNGRTVADLYGYVSERMPKNDPGGLAPEQYVDVVAYLLRLNAMPAGKVELPPDAAVLATIRIEVAEPAARPAARPPAKPLPVRKSPQ